MATVEWPQETIEDVPAERKFGKSYFNGGAGGGLGGYVGEGYRDFPINEITFMEIMKRRPESVLEIGCGRAYVLKRIQDVKIPTYGLEVSRHCIMTRACDGITQWDITKTPWPVSDLAPQQFDILLSKAVLEHIPEKYLPALFAEFQRVSKRGLHGIDFGGERSECDQTHCTLRPRGWWVDRMPQGHEVVDKEELELKDPATGQVRMVPYEVTKPDGKVKLHLGSFVNMHHRDWINVDVLDLKEFASRQAYRFLQRDVRQGLPWGTGSVSLIYSSHMLEHLTFDEARKLLRECRRVIDPKAGAMRLVVPDAGLLLQDYADSSEGSLSRLQRDLEEISDPVSPTALGRIWPPLLDNHRSIWDWETLANALEENGWRPVKSSFRVNATGHEGTAQILRDTIDMFPAISLYTDCYPVTGG